jgi:hypothetical protein
MPTEETITERVEVGYWTYYDDLDVDAGSGVDVRIEYCLLPGGMAEVVKTERPFGDDRDSTIRVTKTVLAPGTWVIERQYRPCGAWGGREIRRITGDPA